MNASPGLFTAQPLVVESMGSELYAYLDVKTAEVHTERPAPLLHPDQVVTAIAKGVSTHEQGNLWILPHVLAGPVPATCASGCGGRVVGPSITDEVAAGVLRRLLRR